MITTGPLCTTTDSNDWYRRAVSSTTRLSTNDGTEIDRFLSNPGIMYSGSTGGDLALSAHSWRGERPLLGN